MLSVSVSVSLCRPLQTYLLIEYRAPSLPFTSEAQLQDADSLTNAQVPAVLPVEPHTAFGDSLFRFFHDWR